MNKKQVKNGIELESLKDWVYFEFPQGRITDPKAFPALFVWDAYFSGVTGAALVFMWFYESDFQNVTA